MYTNFSYYVQRCSLYNISVTSACILQYLQRLADWWTLSVCYEKFSKVGLTGTWYCASLWGNLITEALRYGTRYQRSVFFLPPTRYEYAFSQNCSKICSRSLFVKFVIDLGLHLHNPQTFLPGRFGLYRRSSEEESCSLFPPVLATTHCCKRLHD